jgi:hypothetical protein
MQTGGDPGTGGADCGPSPEAGDLVINEVHSAPDGTTDDTNCDGTPSLSDEFIEIMNATSQTIDLAGVQLLENDVLRHTFSMCLAAQSAIVVYRAATQSTCGVSDWGPDTLGVSADVDFTLSNAGGDVLTLSLDEATLDAVTTFDLSGTPRTSMTRSPDATGTFAVHSTADVGDGSPYSVGTCIDGSFTPCD